jgi:hypothetical protein
MTVRKLDVALKISYSQQGESFPNLGPSRLAKFCYGFALRAVPGNGVTFWLGRGAEATGRGPGNGSAWPAEDCDTKGVHSSMLARSSLTKACASPATARNWNSVLRICEMIEARV